MSRRHRVRRVRDLAVRFLFGDRVGCLVFLASLCLFVGLWRTAFLINDSYTIANGLYAVAHGDIAMTTAEYGSLRSPGTNFYDGDRFSRNYGAIVLSLPFLYGIRALSAVADPRIVIVACWSLLVFATIVLLGREIDARRLCTVVGGGLVTILFVVNVALAQPLESIPYHLLALQLFHMTVAAFAGTLAYRLLTATDGRRLGIAAATVVVGATPLAFWASVPKRHVITATVALAVAVALLYSRDGEHEWSLEARALCYVLIALLAWIHAPEALVLFVAFLVVDVPTAPSNSPRTVGLLAGVFLLALVPLFVTNTLISGDPLTVPRMLRSVSSNADISLTGSASSSGGGGGGSSSDGIVLPTFLLVAVALLQSALEPLTKLLSLVERGFTTLITDPNDAYRTLVRSGYVSRLSQRAQDTAAANLSLLESAPLLAAVVAVVPAGLRTTYECVDERSLPDGCTSADAFLVLFAVTLSLVYIGTLPLHAQVTVRYLFPVTPAVACLAVRLPPIRRALDAHLETMLWTGLAGVLIGSQFVLVALLSLDVARGEAFQFHALLGLAVATLLAVWCLVGSVTDRFDRAGAALLGAATAVATIFVCFAAVEYFGLGQTHALPMVRLIADVLPIQ